MRSFITTIQNMEYPICNTAIKHYDDKRNTIDAGDVCNLNYRQVLVLCVSDKKPGKSRKKK